MFMSRVLSAVLSCVAVVLIYALFFTSNAVPDMLSPQGCQMSYMSPSYILQTEFNSSWTSLAARYSLWLYREVGWDSDQPSGSPVLFIPGNAGSSHQVRSIASSAIRQYLQAPQFVSPEFSSRGIKPLDIYTVEFNEDLSAFHGPTLLAQRSYSLDALRYISSIYSPNTEILVLGHSMGGIVATSLLPLTNISSIITMSTPHVLPPARFDRRIEEIFRNNQAHLRDDLTPIVSLCGGATDMMIPSESCILPESTKSNGVYRKTIFTSALEGCWTGVGHREMVWCHQVRWQVARTALELSVAQSPQIRQDILERWLKDGHELEPDHSAISATIALDSSMPSEIVQTNKNLVVLSPKFPGSRLFVLSNPHSSQFILYVSQGSINSVSPRHPISLRAEVFSCERPDTYLSTDCAVVQPSQLRLLPNAPTNQRFPVPHVGVDEGEGVVLFEAEIRPEDEHRWIVIKLDGADGRGWVAGGFLPSDHTPQTHSLQVGSLNSRASISLVTLHPNSPLKTIISIPQLFSSVLIVYRLTASFPESACSNGLLPPLLVHSASSELHYHRILPPDAPYSRPVFLHTHSSAPYISEGLRRGMNLTIYTSGDLDGCFPERLEIQIDWPTTIGRWGYRYWPAAATWSVGVVCLIISLALWRLESPNDSVPSMEQSLSEFNTKILPYLLPASLIVSLIPLPSNCWLGNIGEAVFAPLAPFLLIVCTGLVNLSWWVLRIGLYTFGTFDLLIKRQANISTPAPAPIFHNKPRIFRTSENSDTAMKPRKLSTTIISILFTIAIVFFLVPWQVAFLGSWIIHYHTCVTSFRRLQTSIHRDNSPKRSKSPVSSSTARRSQGKDYSMDNHNICSHFLLLMTWLLPLTSPILVVWVRTLATAGITTPFDGDHNFFYVAPFLFLVDWCWICIRKLDAVKILHTSWDKRLSARWMLKIATFVAFFYGSRYNYLVFDFVSVGTFAIFTFQIGSRYWKIDEQCTNKYSS